MSQTPTAPKPATAQAGTHIDLKDPVLAAFLAWLWPGAGHLYQGRRAKGVLFMVCILGTFFYGLYIGEGRVVYAAWGGTHQRWPYLCQLGVGLPSLPAAIQTYRVKQGKQPLFSPRFMTPPEVVVPDKFRRSIQTWDLDTEQRRLHRYFEFGTVYTMIAGLLNILVVYDALAGPAFEHEEDDAKNGRTGTDPDDPAADRPEQHRQTTS